MAYPVKFYGHVSVADVDGRQVFKWNAGETVTAVAFDNPIPGYRTNNTINLRLWASRPDREFDLEAFNTGDYVQAILARQRAETLSSVLYPDDRTYQGKELRLKQQHFFVSATIQDVVRRYVDVHGSDFSKFADKVAFQLNDTHPTIAVAELMRVLMDEEGMGWTAAWDVATRVTERLDRTGFADVVPVVDGRDVELRGSVASAADAERAERIVSMVRGVRLVRANMLVAEENGDGGGDT